jgi:hypothetical protein
MRFPLSLLLFILLWSPDFAHHEDYYAIPKAPTCRLSFGPITARATLLPLATTLQRYMIFQMESTILPHQA